MHILIVEDSRLARVELRSLLAELDLLALGFASAEPALRVDEASTVAEGILRVDTLQPDVLLLDIQLPDGDGFALLQQITHMPQVIFTTAFDHYALRAFQVNALDYLQKPIERERLALALKKACSRLPETETKTGAGETNRPTRVKTRQDQIFIKDGERCYFVRLHEVQLFEVEGNYARAYFRDQKPMLARALNYLEQRLDPTQFFRASRQHLINLEHIQSISADVGDGLNVQLKNGRLIEVSRRQARALRELLEL